MRHFNHALRRRPGQRQRPPCAAAVGVGLLVAFASLPIARPAFAQPPPEVDPELLEGLEDLLEEERPQEDQRTADAEDGASPRLGQDPLNEIATRMASLGLRIEQGQIDATTLEGQDAVLEALDRLLEQLGGQPPPSQAGDSEPTAAEADGSESEAGEETELQEVEAGADEASGEDAEGPEGDSGGEDGPGADEAREGGEATGEGPGPAGGRPGSTDVRAAADVPRQEAVWGHLPAQVRGELRSVRPDQYHPRYRELIERYYQRLGELDPE